MPRHADAIGYLDDLAKEVSEPWFTMLCDLAITGISTLDQLALDTLHALFLGRASYLAGTSTKVPDVSVCTPTVPATDFLESLSGFSNFKRLENTLQIDFTKRITIVFGANGSGKSSLCESLKALASPEEPSRPLHNVLLSAGTYTPSFCYKFRSDVALQSWTPTVGYGPRHSITKYFDSEIAHINVKSAVEPGRIIVLTPFKLHVFEWAKSLTTHLRKTLQEVRKEFEGFKDRLLASIDENSLSKLATEIKVGESFAEYDVLKKKQTAMAELEKAVSKEGLRLLKAEQRDMKAFLSALGTFLDFAESLWNLQPVAKAKILLTKRAAQELLAKTLIPENGTLEDLLSLLNTVTPFFALESSSQQACPLCKRKLGSPLCQYK
jgi:energy-coupling factor transporter ATP-binding protein EcfA2